MVRFVPFSELADWSDKFDPESFYVPSFADEDISPAALEERAAFRGALISTAANVPTMNVVQINTPMGWSRTTTNDEALAFHKPATVRMPPASQPSGQGRTTANAF